MHLTGVIPVFALSWESDQMDEHKKRDQQTRQVIANAERLIAEVDDAIARADRLFASHNIDRTRLAKMIEQNPEAARMAEQVRSSIADMEKTMAQQSPRHALEQRLQSAPEGRGRNRRQHKMI